MTNSKRSEMNSKMTTNILDRETPLEESLQRHISHNIAQIICLIDNPEISDSKKIHQIRRYCKHHRALCALIAPITQSEETIKLHQDFYKQIAKTVATDRDTKVLGDTMQRLIKRYEIDAELYTPINTFLSEKTLDKTQQLQSQKLTIIQTLLCQSKSKLTHIALDKNRFKHLRKGIKQTYQKAQTLLNKYQKSRDKETYHTFRKYAKYHMLQLSMIDSDASLEKRIRKLEKLTDKIGKIHDLELLEETIQQEPIANAHRLLPFVKSEQKRLYKSAAKLQKKLFKQNPNMLSHHVIDL